MRMNPSGENKRHRNDLYSTPKNAIKSVTPFLSTNEGVWEPADGLGAISDTLIRYGHKESLMKRTDIEMGRDFFKERELLAPQIVTNPPYSCATEFLLHAMSLKPKKIALLLRLAFLESIKRNEIFTSDEYMPLSKVVVFSNRLKFHIKGAKSGAGMVPYAWFIWDSTHKGKAEIEWTIASKV